MNGVSRNILIACIATAAVAMCAFYFFLDPSAFPFMPRCLFHELTGFQCPGCGSQRMLHALLHGDFAEAWHQNALLLVILPLFPPLIWLELRRDRHPRLYARVHSLHVITILIAAILAWWLLRNLCPHRL